MPPVRRISATAEPAAASSSALPAPRVGESAPAALEAEILVHLHARAAAVAEGRRIEQLELRLAQRARHRLVESVVAHGDEHGRIGDFPRGARLHESEHRALDLPEPAARLLLS